LFINIYIKLFNILFNMIPDINHFNNLSYPLAPNEHEVSIYTKYINGTTLLLGYTKQLIDLCDVAIDLNPPLNPPLNLNNKIIKQDWFTITGHYNIIIGDGVLNLVGGKLVQYLSTHCNTLVIRFFTEKIDGMKYATYFKYNTEFLLPDIIIDTQTSCKILIWHFHPQ
jgi:hypothetical protein